MSTPIPLIGLRTLGRWLVLVLAVVSLVAAVPAHVLPIATGTGDIGGSLATSGLLFTLVGGLVVLRLPDNRLGPLLVVIGACGTLGGLSEAVTSLTYGTGDLSIPGAVWAAWFGEWYWLVLLWGQLVVLPLLFPDGRLPSARWRWFARVACTLGAAEVLMALGARKLMLDAVQLADASETRTVWLDNPVGFLPLNSFEDELEGLVALTALFVVGALWSLVRRFRSATPVERRQLTVAVAGVAVNAIGFVVFGLLDGLFGIQEQIVLLEFSLFLVIPVALGIAILRYRLYDIDRVVSRTVAWVLVSATLVGLYLGGVVVLQSLLRPVMGDAEGDLPVALATLGAAAIARPLLRRVQAAVDRRFNRAHYDASLTVDAFTRSLRDEVSRDAVLDGLRRVSTETLDPASVDVVLVGRPQP